MHLAIKIVQRQWMSLVADLLRLTVPAVELLLFLLSDGPPAQSAHLCVVLAVITVVSQGYVVDHRSIL